jgi:hypothetical protein
VKLALIFLIIPLTAFSGDAQHRSIISNLALASAIDRPLRNMVWISSLDITTKRNDSFLNSSGSTVISGNKLVSSGYDPDITYDVSKFYKKNNYRIQFISNFVLNKPNTIYSIGFDSGVAAQKIKIQNSFFLGLAHVIRVENKSHMVLSVGSWFGGDVKESPCYDLYDRAYWCQNLTSWTDYSPMYPKNLKYIDIRYIRIF